MSVQNESLDVKATERKPEAPELEYKAASQDSLSMFFAAIGGAVLGMLATLLVLALINGGTLNFIHPERLAVLESNLARVNENVGTVSQNVTTVSDQVTQLRGDLGNTTSDLQTARTELQQRANDVANISTSVDSLKVSGQRFETFVAALDQAMTSMDKVGAANGTAAAAATTAAATTAAATTAAGTTAATTTAKAPVVVASSAVKPGNVAVLFFADANGDGKMADNEANLVGVQVTVKDAAGKTVGNYTSTDAGILLEKLAAGQYRLTVDNAAGAKLVTPSEVTFTVPQDGQEGQIIYFPAQ